MLIQEYLSTMESIQQSILDFINTDEDLEEKYQSIIDIINDKKITNDPDKLKSLLYLILKITENIDHPSNYYCKIEKILQFLQNSIKKSFSNSEIFNIFKKSKRILLFLFEEKIIIMNNDILATILTPKYMYNDYLSYFYPEIKPFLTERIEINIPKERYDNFEEKRKIGENHNHICELIRKDLIDDFITYVNKYNVNLNGNVKRSIFETNTFLLGKEMKLIEYCAFFGSFQIFNYLYKNGNELTSSLMLYSIHGANPEIINIFEQNGIGREEEDFYKRCLKESIKCHHNNIVEYIINNYLENKSEVPYLIFKSSLKYYNFQLIQKKIINKSVLYDLCKYDYVYIVRFLFKTNDIEANYRLI